MTAPASLGLGAHALEQRNELSLLRLKLIGVGQPRGRHGDRLAHRRLADVRPVLSHEALVDPAGGVALLLRRAQVIDQPPLLKIT